MHKKQYMLIFVCLELSCSNIDEFLRVACCCFALCNGNVSCLNVNEFSTCLTFAVLKGKHIYHMQQ